MERLYSGFKAGERSVLRAVARGSSIYGAEAALLDLSAGAATHARGALLDRGDLAEVDGHLGLVTPSWPTGFAGVSRSEQASTN